MANWFVLFQDTELELSEVSACLVDAGLKVTQAGDQLTIDDDVRVTVTLEQAAWIKEESAEMAEGHADAARIAQCGVRLLISWADADSAEVTNVLGIIEPALKKKLDPAWVFDPASGEFV